MRSSVEKCRTLMSSREEEVVRCSRKDDASGISDCLNGEVLKYVQYYKYTGFHVEKTEQGEAEVNMENTFPMPSRVSQPQHLQNFLTRVV